MLRLMAKITGLLALLVMVGAYVEHSSYMAKANTSVGIVDPRVVALKSSPIRADWILEGHPDASSAEIARTHDQSTQVMVWQVSAGRFNWFYDFDESVTIIDGEMFLTDGANASPGNKAERRVGPGEVVFFHAGSTATWRVPNHVRKIATLRHPLPGPIATLFRVAKTIKAWTSPNSAMASL